MYGCYNRPPFKQTTEVQDGWAVVGDARATTETTRFPTMRTIPFRMSQECNYTHTELGQADKGCIDCKHRKENP